MVLISYMQSRITLFLIGFGDCKGMLFLGMMVPLNFFYSNICDFQGVPYFELQNLVSGGTSNLLFVRKFGF